MKSFRRPLLFSLSFLMLLAACAGGPNEDQQAAPLASNTEAATNPAISEAMPSDTAPASTEALPEIGPGSVLLAISDLKPMVYIPEGPFLMGASDSDAVADPDEKPQHSVEIDAFWMDQFEVSNEEYFACVQAGGCSPPSEIDSAGFAYEIASAFAKAPVVNVSWGDAGDYCAWVNKRLPTEAEWEKAARGEDGRTYPWGMDPNARKKAWFCEECIFSRENPEVLDDFSRPIPVGNFPDGNSPYNAADLAGNVWEWVQDWYADDTYLQLDQVNPQGPVEGDFRVVRGGSWTSPSTYLRTTYRQARGQDSNWIDVGFRCVMADKREALVHITQITPSPTLAVPSVTPNSGDDAGNNQNDSPLGNILRAACSGLEPGDACSYGWAGQQINGVCTLYENGPNPAVLACAE